MPLVWTPDILNVTSAFSPRHPQAKILFQPETEISDSPTERVFVSGPCSSALDVAWHLAKNAELAVWDSVLCTEQWAGRGQMRRTWISEPGNLFAAWRLPPPPAPWQNLISILLGWAMCMGLQDLGLPVTLKWPNDLLLDDRKIGGLLIEERGDVLLAGIGLNLVSQPPDFLLRSERACLAGNCATLLPKWSLFRLWLHLVNCGRLRYVAQLSGSTPLEFSQAITAVLAWYGSAVRVTDARISIGGVHSGLSPDGGLVLLVNGGKRIFHSGSLSSEDWSIQTPKATQV